MGGFAPSKYTRSALESIISVSHARDPSPHRERVSGPGGFPAGGAGPMLMVSARKTGTPYGMDRDDPWWMTNGTGPMP